MQDQKVTLRLIPKKIAHGEGNVLDNERGPSRELQGYSSTVMASQHETADRHTA